VGEEGDEVGELLRALSGGEKEELERRLVMAPLQLKLVGVALGVVLDVALKSDRWRG
jgi:hypothetical protein